MKVLFTFPRKGESHETPPVFHTCSPYLAHFTGYKFVSSVLKALHYLPNNTPLDPIRFNHDKSTFRTRISLLLRHLCKACQNTQQGRDHAIHLHRKKERPRDKIRISYGRRRMRLLTGTEDWV